MVRHGKTTRYDTGDALAFMENWDRSGTSPRNKHCCIVLYRAVSGLAKHAHQHCTDTESKLDHTLFDHVHHRGLSLSGH